jgi:hypothetical protein
MRFTQIKNNFLKLTIQYSQVLQLNSCFGSWQFNGCSQECDSRDSEDQILCLKKKIPASQKAL